MQNQVVSREERKASRHSTPADWLSLAAAPTFAFMALLTAVPGSGPLDMLCASGASPFSGMVLMYLLMSAFHLAPWLRLISARRTQRRNWAYWA